MMWDYDEEAHKNEKKKISLVRGLNTFGLTGDSLSTHFLSSPTKRHKDNVQTNQYVMT